MALTIASTESMLLLLEGLDLKVQQLILLNKATICEKKKLKLQRKQEQAENLANSIFEVYQRQ